LLLTDGVFKIPENVLKTQFSQCQGGTGEMENIFYDQQQY
jgi:hypothetical protein